MTVYLLHFDSPINPARPCRHYIGSTKDLNQRLTDHRHGRGARLTAVAIERGISWKLAAVWDGGRQLERQLKRQKNAPRMCPICAKNAARENAVNEPPF